jgi:hypothetical protein
MMSDSESRVTRSKRNLRSASVMFAVCLVIVGVLRAQEAPRPAPPPTQPAAAAAPAEQRDEAAAGDAESGDRGADSKTKKPNDGPGVVGPTPDRFEPTEKVRADFDVSFPVDI